MNTNSIISHQSIIPHKAEMHNKIMDALEIIGEGSFRDIAKQANLRDEQVWKRLSELERDGKVSNIGTKLCEVSHRPVSIWKINAKAY